MDNLLLTKKFPRVPGTHSINLIWMKGYVDFGVTQCFDSATPGLCFQYPNYQAIALQTENSTTTFMVNYEFNKSNPMEK